MQFEDWLADLDESRLAELLRLRPDVALDPPPRTYASLGYLLHSQRSMAAVLRTVDRGALEVLAAVEDHPTREALGVRFDEGVTNFAEDIDRALAVLVDRGIVWPTDDGYRASPTYGRDFARSGPPQRLASPPVRPARPAPPSSQQLAVARYCDAADAVLSAVDSGTVPVLKSGGIGARVVRSLAKNIKEDDVVVELALTLAVAAGVVTVRDPVARCTTDLPAWHASGRSSKWARSVAMWWCAGVSPTNRPPSKGKATPVLGTRAGLPSTTRLRHRMIAATPDAGFASEADAVDYFEWAMPELVRDAQPGDVAAVWREAIVLGILADGTPTELTAELARLGAVDAEEVAETLEPVARRVVDGSECTLRLLPDLTAVVSGPVSEQVSELLSSAADVETKDAASTWRFTPGSVRRYLDSGRTADGLLDELTRTASTDVPQSLDYLVNDCARRHGRVQVLTASSVIVSEDVSLIRELEALGELKSTAVAPTVLVSRLAASHAMGVMRNAGHSPVPRGANVVVARAKSSGEVSRSVVIDRTGYDPATMAAALVAGTVVDVDLEHVARRLGPGTRLPARDVSALALAVSHGAPVAADLVVRSGIVRDELRDAVLDSGFVHAWSLRANGRRSIALTDIRMVRALPS